METNPLISVIVPVYNVEKLLPKCVDSILAQTHDNLEIILVDDGTPDRGGMICDEYAARDPRVRVIHKENGGLSSARNAGLDIARGEYIGFVDSDDWIEPEMYGTMLSLAKKHDVKLVCAGRYDVSERTGEKKKGLCPDREEVVSGEELAGRIFLWQGLDSAAWDKLYHRSLWQSRRYPHGRINEDIPVTYRIALEAGRVALCPEPFYNYFHRAGSITTTRKVTDKSFHYPEHAAQVYDHICREHPSLKPQAAYLRVRSLAYTLLMLDQADGQTRAKYAATAKNARKELRTFTGFILSCPYLGRKEAVTDLLLMLDLYRILRPVFHRR